MAIPAQALFKLMTPTTSPVLLNNASPPELLKFATSVSDKPRTTTINSSSQFSITSINNNASMVMPMMSPSNKCMMINGTTISTSPSSASKRNKRKSLEPKKVNTLDVEGSNNNNSGMVRKLNFDPSSNNTSSSVTRLFESSSPSGNSQKSDVSVDSGNSSSCCRSPSPDTLSPKRRKNTSSAHPKKRFKEDPTLNLVFSDANDKLKDSNDTRKINNPFRPWGDCNKEEEEEEEINDDEDDCFVDVERQSPTPMTSSSPHLTHSRLYEERLSNASSSPLGNASFVGNHVLPSLPSTIPSLPITPQLITANHQQLVQASQNLLTLSKLYPNLVDMNTLASVAAAAQLAASTAAAAAVAGSNPSNIPSFQPNLINHRVQTPNRPHLAGIQEQYSMVGKIQGVEPEQEEPLALIKKPSKPEVVENPLVQPINYTLSKKMASLKENHQPSIPANVTGLKKEIEELNKKGGKKSTDAEKVTTQQQRNYKNMTRERRVEANARERQRVHTITAAFDTLQSLIPAPEDVVEGSSTSSSDASMSQLSNLNNQKLSKLSIVKIATSYIMLLSRMAGYDYSEDKSEPSIEDCVKKCSELLTQETKVKRSRDTIIKVENKM